MKKKIKKKVKGWGAYRQLTKSIFCADGCGPLAIFKTKKSAKSLNWVQRGYCSVIPCTIEFEVPHEC